jgi:hypothetical protein
MGLVGGIVNTGLKEIRYFSIIINLLLFEGTEKFQGYC